jgi:hypothetical protein
MLVGFDLVLKEQRPDWIDQARLFELDLEDRGGGEPGTAYQSALPGLQTRGRDIGLEPHMFTDMNVV